MQPADVKKKPILRLLLVFSLLGLAACSGGSGGDTATDSRPMLTYTGSTDKMLIDESNAAEVITGAVDNGIRGNAFDRFAILEETTGSYAMQNHSVLHLAMKVEEAVFALKEHSSPTLSSIMAVHTDQKTIKGSCGGEGSGSISFDDGTGEFWGELLFSDYCESTVTLNGQTSFSGTFNLSTGELENFSFDFKMLKGSDASRSFTIDGTMFLDPTVGGTAVTMNLFLQESQGSDVFWLNDYRLEVFDDRTTMTIDISGKYYHPDYGYVTLSTREDLVFDINQMMPVSGVLLAMGKNGSAGGPTMATLTCYSDGRFQAEADTDGDGVYDWDSGVLFWDES